MHIPSDLVHHTIDTLLNVPQAGWTYIYGLCDPQTKAIRYVGKSRALVKRFLHHLSQSRQAGFKRHSACWLSGLIQAGTPPTIVILEAIPPPESATWEVRERHWIAALRASGCDLTNITRGGEGGATYGRLGKKNSPEHIAKTRAGRIGKPCKRVDPEGWNKRKAEGVKRYYARMKEMGIAIKRGPASDERKRKISEANKGRTYTMSPEHKQKCHVNLERARQASVVGVVQREIDGREIARFASIRDAAAATGVRNTAISNCVTGRCKTAGGFVWSRVNPTS